MKSSLVPALVYGGLGIKGIADTSFYKFVTSPAGLSQLGIRPGDPAALLNAYLYGYKIVRSKTTIELRFGEEKDLIRKTPHWANNTGKLRINSWMTWILTNRIVADYGYVPRPSLPKGLQRRIRLSDPLGGLMLSKGKFRSSGRWQFPSVFKDYYVTWFNQNQSEIAKLMDKQFRLFLQVAMNV